MALVLAARSDASECAFAVGVGVGVAAGNGDGLGPEVICACADGRLVTSARTMATSAMACAMRRLPRLSSSCKGQRMYAVSEGDSARKYRQNRICPELPEWVNCLTTFLSEIGGPLCSRRHSRILTNF